MASPASAAAAAASHSEDGDDDAGDEDVGDGGGATLAELCAPPRLRPQQVARLLDLQIRRHFLSCTVSPRPYFFDEIPELAFLLRCDLGKDPDQRQLLPRVALPLLAARGSPESAP